MTGVDPKRRVLHLAESPNDSLLLTQQLAHQGLDVLVERAGDAASLEGALADPPDLIIADLPLPWPDAEDDLARAQGTHPQLGVVFRLGQLGSWQLDEPTMQIGHEVARALSLQVGARGEDYRRAVSQQVARQQAVLLRLSRLDFWHFESALAAVTEAIADLLEVERVSVWEFTEDERLVSLDMFQRSRREHTSGDLVEGHPRYMQALEYSLSIAANDARRDPRTSEFTGDYLVPNRISSMLDAPIRRRGRVAGVLCIEHTGPQRHWQLQEQCLAAGGAGLVARGMETRDRLRVEANLQRARRIEALGRVAGQIAHDFNNRLTVLSLLADQVRQETDAAARAAATEQMIDELRRARQHVRRLLELNRASASTGRGVDLTAAVAAELPTIEHLLRGHLVRFESHTGPLPVALRPDDVRELLTNLATNARDTMGAAGGKFTLRLHHVQGHGEGDRAILTAEDTGAGFSADALEHLFEPFFSTKSVDQGSGLGLASIQFAVQAAGGEVRVHSQPGRGARIEIVLPLRPKPS